MARDLRINIEGDSSSADKAFASATAALEKTQKELRQAEQRTDALAIKARKLAEAEERAGDKTRELARHAAELREQIEKSGDSTGQLGRKLDRLTRDTKSAALATDDYRRSADRAARDAREQARAYDKVADNARQAARAVVALRLAGVGRGANGGGGGGGGLFGAIRGIGGGFAEGGFGGASSAINGAVGTPILGPALLAAGAAAAIPAASFVGGAAGGGVLAGIGGVGIGAGLAGAWAGNPDKYAKAWENAADRFKKRWIASSAAFGNELDGVLKTADTTLQRLPIEKVLALSQSFVNPLAQGAGQGTVAAANGFADALQGVQIVVDRLGPEIANFGADVGDAFRAIGLGAVGGSEALGDLVNVAGYAVKATGVLILGFENAYHVIREFAGGVNDAARAIYGFGFSDVAREFLGINDTLIVTGRALKGSGDAAKGAAESWGDWITAGAEAQMAATALNDALTKLQNTQLGMADSTVAVAQGWLDLKEELEDGARTLDLNTQAGIDNQKALIKQAELLEQKREQEIAASDGTQASIDKANAAYNSNIEKLKQAAYAAGYDKQKVDELIGSLDTVPDNTTANVEVRGLKPALDNGYALGNLLNRIDGSYYYATVDVSYQSHNPGIALGSLLHHARGGSLTETGPFVAGEHGPEVVWGSMGQYVSTQEQTRKLVSMMGSAGASSGGVGQLQVVVAPGGDSAVGALVQTLVDRGVIQIFAGGQQVSTRRS